MNSQRMAMIATCLLAFSASGAAAQQQARLAARIEAAQKQLTRVRAEEPRLWCPYAPPRLADRLGELFFRESDPRRKAARELKAALSLDEAHPEAAVMLAEVAACLMADDDLTRAAYSLGRVDEAGRGTVETALWRARLALLAGDTTAAALAERYRAAGGDPALAMLLVARAAFQAEEDERGANAYFAGLSQASPAVLAEYLRELGPLAIAEEVGRTDPAGIRAYWEADARGAGVPLPTRVGEHYRRMELAYRRFRLVSLRTINRADMTVIPLPVPLVAHGLDDRAAVMVLRGVPDRVIRAAPSCAQAESWIYEQAGPDLVFHFGGGRGREGYMLVDMPEMR